MLRRNKNAHRLDLGRTSEAGIDATQRRVAVAHAELPPFLERVTIRDLRIADASVDLLFERRARDVGVTVLERRGDVEVAITK